MKSKNWYEIKAAASGRAEIYLLGDIVTDKWDESEVSAKEFIEELVAIEAKDIDLYINSGGGAFFPATAMYNALRRHPAEIVTHVDGLAASSASLIAMAGDVIEIADNALMMIHNPWAMVMVAGDADDVRQAADQTTRALDAAKQAMLVAYKRSNMSESEISSAMDEETWYTAEQALNVGLADGIFKGRQIAASIDSARYRNQPENLTSMSGGEKPMTAETETITAVEDPLNLDEIKAAAKKKALAEDRKRRADIAGLFAKFPAQSELLGQCQENIDCTPADASRLLIEALGKDAEPLGGSGRTGGRRNENGPASRDKFIAGVSQAIMARAMVAGEKHDSANEWNGYTLKEIVRASLHLTGVDTRGMDESRLLQAAISHGASDFPAITENVANKAMMQGYGDAAETFQTWTVAGTLSDFKIASRADLGGFNSLREVRRGAEIKYITTADDKEPIQLATYAELFSIDRQTLIDDDMGAFTRIPGEMGRAAAGTIGDLVYGQLTGNLNMSDGSPLFDASHNNILTGAALSTASVDAARTAMGTQKRLGVTDRSAGIPLVYIITPLALNGAALTVRNSQFEVGTTTRNNTVPNSQQNRFDVVSDSRLDDDDPAQWYGASDRNTVEVAYLNGRQEPMIERMDGWGVLGLSWRVYIDASAKALNWRFLNRNAGA